MPRLATSWTVRGVRRTAAVAASAGLGAAALCLVVFGASLKHAQLGVLLGLWSALIAAFLIFGGRPDEPGRASAEEVAEARAQAAELHEAQLKVVAAQQEQLESARQAYFSQEIELRQFSEAQLARDAAARRESELQLELSLRREVERVLSEQLGSLREEVAALRAEVVDKLGGQLRLERIETTRVIGSDLEALHHEIRRLAAANQESLAAPPRVVTAGPPAQPGLERRAEAATAGLVEFPPPAADLSAGSDARLAERSSGRRRAPEPDPEDRYRGRRRADSDGTERFARLDS